MVGGGAGEEDAEDDSTDGFVGRIGSYGTVGSEGWKVKDWNGVKCMLIILVKSGAWLRSQPTPLYPLP